MKTVLITDASSGVGKAAAELFAKNGYRVLLLARSAAKLDAIAATIGDLAVSTPCDASDAKQVEDVANRILSDYGPPDVILHCAGAGQWKKTQDTPPAEAMLMMQAPYFAAFNVTHFFLAKMLERGSGYIVHVNSPACLTPWPSSAGYAAARSALAGFHEALSQDLAGTGVQSCHVIFGKINSEYFDNNPGVAEKIPAFAKLLPTLSTKDCAKVLLRVARKPKHSTIVPFNLRVSAGLAALTPGLARWLLRL